MTALFPIGTRISLNLGGRALFRGTNYDDRSSLPAAWFRSPFDWSAPCIALPVLPEPRRRHLWNGAVNDSVEADGRRETWHGAAHGEVMESHPFCPSDFAVMGRSAAKCSLPARDLAEALSAIYAVPSSLLIITCSAGTYAMPSVSNLRGVEQ